MTGRHTFLCKKSQFLNLYISLSLKQISTKLQVFVISLDLTCQAIIQAIVTGRLTLTVCLSKTVLR